MIQLFDDKDVVYPEIVQKQWIISSLTYLKMKYNEVISVYNLLISSKFSHYTAC